ncbi:HNH endonuclease [Flavobacterium ardleyense]|uniref:HNH endonuclease n=1 Tax=Flavobacterium ardleyense TaxID=2038737 RepID=UPI0038739B67
MQNTVARSLCINHYGFKCQVCEFDFEKKFGEIGKNFIHVHHVVDISTIGSEYELDPIVDLKPVCPNCHAVLHKKRPSYNINELKSFIIN